MQAMEARFTRDLDNDDVSDTSSSAPGTPTAALLPQEVLQQFTYVLQEGFDSPKV